MTNCANYESRVSRASCVTAPGIIKQKAPPHDEPPSASRIPLYQSLSLFLALLNCFAVSRTSSTFLTAARLTVRFTIMGDVAVENPALALHNKPAPLDTIPNIDSLEGTGSDGGDEYATLKRLQRHLECVASSFPWVVLALWPILTI